MQSLGMLTLHGAPLESPLQLAWHHTGEFWRELAAAIAHHPLPILMCAAVPAVERAFAYLHPGSVDRGRLALLEALVTIWRVLLVVLAVWVATSGVQWQQLRQQVGVMAAWQVSLSLLGAHLAHHLRMVLWEIFFLLAALLAAYWLILGVVRMLGAPIPWLRAARHKAATLSIIRNLIFAPVLVIYLVEMARPAFQ